MADDHVGDRGALPEPVTKALRYRQEKMCDALGFGDLAAATRLNQGETVPRSIEGASGCAILLCRRVSARMRRVIGKGRGDG